MAVSAIYCNLRSNNCSVAIGMLRRRARAHSLNILLAVFSNCVNNNQASITIRRQPVHIQRRPEVIACGVFFAAAPLLVGILGTIDGLFHSFAFSTESDADMPLILAVRMVTATFTTAFGMVCSLPAYCVLAIGYFVGVLQSRGSNRPGQC